MHTAGVGDLPQTCTHVRTHLAQLATKRDCSTDGWWGERKRRRERDRDRARDPEFLACLLLFKRDVTLITGGRRQ